MKKAPGVPGVQGPRRLGARLSPGAGFEPARSGGPIVKKLPVIQQVIRLRKRQGLSQSQVGKRMGVSQPAIAKLESGRIKNLQLATLQRIADALGGPLRITIKPQKGFPRLKEVTGRLRKDQERRLRSTSPTGKPRVS
jgi:transcriptional regulator with XRE-family HTH domain